MSDSGWQTYAIGIATAGLIVAAVAVDAGSKRPASSQAPAEAAAEPPPKPRIDQSDLAQNSSYLAENRVGMRSMLALFRRRGLLCPAIVHMWAKGITPYGERYEVLCGPSGTADAYTSLHYAVYPARGAISVCQPFGTSFSACE
jgi:hypothetical protein